MSDIEKKIRDNLAYFDENEPGEGHRDRFIRKMSVDKKKKRFNISLISKVAASLILIVGISVVLVNQIKIAKSNNLYVTQIKLPDDILEMQSYYDQMSQAKLQSIDSVARNKDEADRLKKIAQKKMDNLDAGLAMIEKEYMKNPECDRLKEALVNNSKKKVEVIDNIVEQAGNAKRGYHVGTMFDKF